MVTTPTRAPSGFGWTLSSTAPDPLPLAPAVMAIHGADVVAVHWQSLGLVTITRTVSPEAGTSCSDDERLTWQGAACCAMRTLTPLMTSWVCRAALDGLAATSKRTLPPPCPDAGSTRATHAASAAAVHAHSGVVTSATSPLPPADGSGVDGPVSVTAHFTGLGAVDVTAVEPQALRRPATTSVDPSSDVSENS